MTAGDPAHPGPGVRALHVVASPGPAVPTHLRSLLPRLTARGLDVRLAVAGHLADQYTDGSPDRSRDGGVPATTSGGTPGPPVSILSISEQSRTAGDVAAAGELRRIIRDSGAVDVVHAHGFRSCALATLALRGMRSRPAFAATWYDLALPTGPRGLSVRAAERLIARSADVTLATSSELQARARELGARDVRLSPIALPRGSAPLVSRDDLRAEYATELGLRADRPWVLAVGRLVPERTGQLMTVAERWNVLYPPPEVLAVGEGPPGVVAALRLVVQGRRLPVHFLGAREDTDRLMPACDVMVATSRWETRPLAVQQAMQTGLPIVGSRIAGIAELVADTAVLVDPDDVEALAGEVAALLSDPERAARLARRAFRRVGTFPSEDEVADTVVAAYSAAVGSRRGPA